MKYLSMLQQGGPVIALIALCALIAAFIFIWKWFEFYRAQMDVNEIVTGLTNVLRRDGMIEARPCAESHALCYNRKRFEDGKDRSEEED